MSDKSQQYSLHLNPEITRILGFEQTKEGGLGPLGIERIELLENGENEVQVKAHAELLLIKKPIDLYYLSWVYAHPGKNNLRSGSALIKKINDFLKLNNKPGLLFNDIKKNVNRFYSRNQWQPVPNHNGWFSYNLPANLTAEEIAATIENIMMIDPHFANRVK